MLPLNHVLTGALMFTGLVTAAVALYAWRRRTTKAEISLGFFMFSLAIYSAGYGMELVSETLPQMLFWSRFQYVGIAPIPALFLSTAIHASGRERWLHPAVSSALFLIPVFTLLFKFTDDRLHLMYAAASMDLAGPFPRLAFTPGPWYWVHISYSNLSILIGNILFMRMLVRTAPLYRRHAFIILAGSFIPWAALIVYLAGGAPLGLDLNPFSFSTGALVVSWGIFRYHIMDITPVAHDAVFDAMGDGVLVLDRLDRLVNVNRAAGELIGVTPGDVGLSIEMILTSWPAFEGECWHPLSVGERCVVRDPGNERWLDLRVSPLMDRRGRAVGRLMAVRDVTEQRRLEMIIADNEKHLKDELARVRDIQAVLMPVLTPRDGYDMASLFLAADELSGDFFSGTLIDDGVYQVVLCDVMEHGASASYIGMEIRSIFNTMSGAGTSPAGLIGMVNGRLYDDFKSIRYYATVVVCRLDLATGEVVYSSAGHPPALHLQADGDHVDEVAFAGPIIGLQRNARYQDHRFTLAPGESLLLYTDGIYEARITGGDDQYGLARLKEDLRQNAGTSARDILRCVIANVFEFTGHDPIDDDITMICIKRSALP